ncbi:hypothetical protein ADK34_39315 [Streptomyces viridochromogenes]|uniref:Uncharacterized protein n=1 Tax=Streptomyces viridochromogenes TaxID=1938 RepID=A0A0L8J3K5_STRVR|nr:hypothetical protein ADK34_39315 [Streptomyces viridochromogenes]
MAVPGEETPVDFVMTDSPYETHSWQYLMGNIEPDSVHHSGTTIPLAESVASVMVIPLRYRVAVSHAAAVVARARSVA